MSSPQPRPAAEIGSGAFLAPGQSQGAGSPPDYLPDVPAHATASYESFLRDLPELMLSHPGQCAAYEDGIRKGIGPSRRDFFRQMYESGCDPKRLLFFTIEPQEEREIELLTPEV
jgi:hypothetical protein